MTETKRVECLDKGFVRLVDHMGSDLTVVNAARVSFAKESKWDTDGDHAPFVLSDKDTRLIRYLAKHNHWTPFGHAQVTLHFKMPLFVARQAMRSNVGICWNEVSRRYVDDTPEFYEPDQWRVRPEGSIKQGSGEPVTDRVADGLYDEATLACERVYSTLIDKGYAPEMVRMVLPQSMFTECWGTFSLAALARFHGLRADSHAQVEVQEYARAIATLVGPLFPVAWEALTEGSE